jgi:hypothetical protein
MALTERVLSFHVSEFLFRLTTESVRLFSNRHLRKATIEDVLNDRAAKANDIPFQYRPASLREHLRIIPTEGDVEFEIQILETSANAIGDSIPDLESMLGSSVSFASAVSLVLFDYIVDQNRTEFINKLGLPPEEAEAFKRAAERYTPNVVPFR